MKVQEVKYLSDYNISVKFEDGVSGTVQLNDLVEKGIFKVLQDKNQFAKVYTNGHSIAWSNELEIDAITIYSEQELIDICNIINESINEYSHAV